ncbi:MAG: tRNA (adenosine(37)-N6)-threonylcarbamoyltransferase complex dimerization subunit type 1 TsaB [Candidatus Nomurabacteria bacterium]|jgi:tRNA threonylcarbamoyladenosine biosynthesis protein TsaB|nr:tRNA (adenosine(37)-N6)-threonylcarbamoyltransferase complex dimerization subunit type 1 TsaB [Candidatus Nomurabacteria bacterium]
MILYLKTAGSSCELWLAQNIGSKSVKYEWEAGRELACGLLKFIRECLHEQGADWQNVKGIGVFEGPGSFTSLRIGTTVANTLASSENVPIIGARGNDWLKTVQEKLAAGESYDIVLPFYGGKANVTLPKHR